MPRNYGLRSRNETAGSQIIPPGSCKLGSLDCESFSSGLKESVAGGFLIAFAVLCGSLFGVMTLFASMLIEPLSVSEPVQYQSHFDANRHPG